MALCIPIVVPASLRVTLYITHPDFDADIWLSDHDKYGRARTWTVPSALPFQIVRQ